MAGEQLYFEDSVKLNTGIDLGVFQHDPPAEQCIYHNLKLICQEK